MPENPAILKNKGTKIELLAVEPLVRESVGSTINDQGVVVSTTKRRITYQPVLDSNGEAVSVAEWVRFTNASLAALQSYYGSMELFQKASEDRPNEAVGVALAAMLDVDLNDADEMAQFQSRLDPQSFNIYQIAVMAMLSIANGVDPTVAASMIEEGRQGAEEMMVEATKVLQESVDEMAEDRLKRKAEAEAEAEKTRTEPMDTTGSDGSDSGLELVADTLSSGS